MFSWIVKVYRPQAFLVYDSILEVYKPITVPDFDDIALGEVWKSAKSSSSKPDRGGMDGGRPDFAGRGGKGSTEGPENGAV